MVKIMTYNADLDDEGGDDGDGDDDLGDGDDDLRLCVASHPRIAINARLTYWPLASTWKTGVDCCPEMLCQIFFFISLSNDELILGQPFDSI